MSVLSDDGWHWSLGRHRGRIAPWAAAMSCASFSALIAATPSDAADTRGGALEEVIVTAQKQTERLQDVPVPVTAVDAEILSSVSQLRVQDYYNKIPGLGVAVTGNGNEPAVTIRGVTTGSIGLSPTVGLVVDEIPYGSSVATGGATPVVADIDPGDLSHVEVLRGPQGTLYGASNMGGLIKFVTIDPSTEGFSGRVHVGSTSVSESDELGYSVRASVNVPLSDTFAVRVSGFSVREPGYIDNVETGQDDVNRRDSQGGRVSALWRPSDVFSLKLSALVQKKERKGTDDHDTSLGEDLEQAFLRGTGEYNRDSEAYSATMVAKLGSVELTSATGYSVDKLFDDIDISTYLGGFFSTVGASLFGSDRAATLITNEVEKLSQEVRAAIPLGSSVTWLVGGLYSKEDTVRTVDNQAVFGSTGDLAGSLFKNSYDPSKFEEHAFFTNLTFDVTERLDVQVGGRYSSFEQSYPVVRTGPIAALLFGSDPFVSPDLRSDDTATTYLLTPRFKISPDLMVYARFASGYRPGGPNATCGTAGIPCSFDPDSTQNYDLGIKGTVAGGSLSFDGSVYYIDWKDIQIPGALASNGFPYTANASRAKSQGVEVSLMAKPMTGLTLSTWVAYDDAELTEPLPRGNLFGNKGDRLPYSSRVSGSFSVDIDFPVWSSSSAFVGGSVMYVGDRKGLFQTSAVQRETFPAYTQLDLRTGLNSGNWTVDLFANNVTDERGVLRSGVDASLNPAFVAYIQPRTIGVSFSKSF